MGLNKLIKISTVFASIVLVAACASQGEKSLNERGFYDVVAAGDVHSKVNNIRYCEDTTNSLRKVQHGSFSELTLSLYNGDYIEGHNIQNFNNSNEVDKEIFSKICRNDLHVYQIRYNNFLVDNFEYLLIAIEEEIDLTSRFFLNVRMYNNIK